MKEKSKTIGNNMVEILFFLLFVHITPDGPGLPSTRIDATKEEERKKASEIPKHQTIPLSLLSLLSVYALVCVVFLSKYLAHYAIYMSLS